MVYSPPMEIFFSTPELPEPNQTKAGQDNTAFHRQQTVMMRINVARSNSFSLSLSLSWPLQLLRSLRNAVADRV